MVRLSFGILAGFTIATILGAALQSHAQEATPDDVHFWVNAYSVWYANPSHPYDQLIADVERVARCESAGFDPAVINNHRRGRFGEIGTGQWMPGPRSIWYVTPQAQAGYLVTDPEANVAGLVWSISQGLGPKHWSCWWK